MKAISPASYRNPVPQRTIDVTADIIAKSIPGIQIKCAVAQVLRLKHGASSVQITAERIIFTAPGKMFDGTECLMRYNHPTPSVAAINLINFDKTGVMEPFKFRLQDGNNSSATPARTYPNRKGRGPTKNRTEPKSKVDCIRRFHGLKVVEVRV